ncbi:hypothetical protein MD484_g664, partial [Candolleomyces efflorescens]
MILNDQHVYEEAEEFITTGKLFFGDAIVTTLGDHHRKQRKILNPAFSAASIREMTPIFLEVAGRLQRTLVKEVSKGEIEIDVLAWTTRTALELIGQAGYGYSFDSLEVDAVEHPFYTSIRKLAQGTNDATLVVARMLLLKYVKYVTMIGTGKFRRAIVNLLPWKKLHELRDMVDVMHNTSVEIFESTKRSLEAGEHLSNRIGKGKDVMSLLLKANNAASDEDKLPETELLAQISTLTFAGMDTTSNALSRILHLLSENQNVQDKLRLEILSARKEHGEFTYDVLNSLPYLDAVCRESLRVYATVPFLRREARKTMILPLSKPITSTDGKLMSEIVVPKDTTIFISLLDCNLDPEIWGPDAAEWKPERWMSPLPETVTAAKIPGVYSNLMTFLGGGRACIGFKFSQLEMKVVLCLLLEVMKFSPTGKKVLWENNLIVQPTTEDAKVSEHTMRRELQLPLKVSLI